MSYGGHGHLDDATEWRLVRKIIGNRAAAGVTDSGTRSARILRYVKTADLKAMAAEFGIADEDVEEKLTKLVEGNKGFSIEKPEDAYKKVVQVKQVDVLNGSRT